MFDMRSTPVCPHVAPTHPSTSGKSRIRACARFRRPRPLRVPGEVTALRVLGMTWAQVTGCGSSAGRNREHSRENRHSTRGPLRPMGSMLCRDEEAGRGDCLESERGRR